MILALDTFYFENKAKTACIAFEHWTSNKADHVYSEVIENIHAYRPGEFYRRELPCILSLLKQITMEKVESIIIDGYVYLDDMGKPGLGGRLYDNLNGKIPVIGVAKTNFHTLGTAKKSLCRGKSTRPLFITAAGLDLNEATELIRSMSGEHRMPTLLKMVDTLTKKF